MANLLEWLKEIICSKASEPKVFGTINWDEVTDIIEPHIKKSNKIYLSDTNYSLTSVDEIRKFLYNDRLNYQKYTESHDCDNFSYQLMGYFSQWSYSFCFGIAWSGTHAFNIFIDKDKKLYVIEPQNDAIYTMNEIKKSSNLKQYYPFELILI